MAKSGRVRNVFGTAAPTQDHYNGIKYLAPSADANPLRANKTRFAFPWKTRGTMAIVKIGTASAGAVAEDAPMLEQVEAITDFDFSPFADDILAVSGDTSVNIWRVPDEIPAGLAPIHTMSQPHEKRIIGLTWHPLVSGLMMTTAMDKAIKFWDVDHGATNMLTLDGSLHGDALISFTWNYEGTTLATTAKDKKLRVIDPRSSTVTADVVCHEGAKAARAVWLGQRDQILTVGFKKGAPERELAIFDVRNMSKRVASQDLDAIPSSIFPFFDADLGIVYLVGKGDGNVRLFELTDSAKILEACGEFRSPQAQSGFAFMPKTSCDVMKCEVGRLLKLQGNSVVPIRFEVTRQNAGYMFQSDLFPDTFDGKAVYTPDEWLSGASKRPGLTSLNPELRK